MQPCERILEFQVPAGEYAVIDTAWMLSQLNRRSYRQGMQYAYEKLEIYQVVPTTAGVLSVSRFPNTWVTVNAWVKAFHAWKNQQDDVLEETDYWSTVSKYRDFKIQYNAGHASGSYAGGTNNVTQPVPYGVHTLSAAQAIDSGAEMNWDYSQFVVPNLDGSGGTTGEFTGIMLGDDDTSGAALCMGLIKAYALSRARPHPEDPSTVNDATLATPSGLYAQMRDVGEDMIEIQGNIIARNDSPPYIVGGTDSSKEFYLGGSNSTDDGGVTIDKLIVRANSTVSTDACVNFTALCGLLWLNNTGADDLECRLTVAAGPYLGVMARPMQDVN